MIPTAQSERMAPQGKARKVSLGGALPFAQGFTTGERVRRNAKGFRIGAGHQNAKLDETKVAQIRREYLAYVRGYGYFAKLFGVKWATVRDVVQYRTWPHVVVD